MVMILLILSLLLTVSGASTSDSTGIQRNFCASLYIYQELGYTHDRYPFGDKSCENHLDSTSLKEIKKRLSKTTEVELANEFQLLALLIKNRKALLSGNLASNSWKIWPSTIKEQFSDRFILPWINQLDGLALYWSRKDFRIKEYLDLSNDQYLSYMKGNVNTKMWCRDASKILIRLKDLDSQHIYVKSFEDICPSP